MAYLAAGGMRTQANWTKRVESVCLKFSLTICAKTAKPGVSVAALASNYQCSRRSFLQGVVLLHAKRKASISSESV